MHAVFSYGVWLPIFLIKLQFSKLPFAFNYGAIVKSKRIHGQSILTALLWWVVTVYAIRIRKKSSSIVLKTFIWVVYKKISLEYKNKYFVYLYQLNTNAKKILTWKTYTLFLFWLRSEFRSSHHTIVWGYFSPGKYSPFSRMEMSKDHCQDKRYEHHFHNESRSCKRSEYKQKINSRE